jgi:hypothetical protein
VLLRGGAEESKGVDGQKEKDGGATAALPHAMAPWERPACIAAATQKRRRDAAATRLLSFCTRWRLWKRQAQRRRGFTASGEVTENRATTRRSVGFVKIK